MTDREKLIELLCNLPTPEFVVGTRRAGKKLITAGFIADHLIANGVTVQENTASDVAPVRHGRWIDAYPDIEPNPMFMYGICSECGFEQGISKYLNYCPNCGAKMDAI